VTVKNTNQKNGNNHGTFTTKVVRSVFVLLATRGHDILYRLGGDDTPWICTSRDSYFRVLYCAQP